MPYSDEYCCAVIVNGKFLARQSRRPPPRPRALCSKAANGWKPIPRAAAQLSVEKKYLASTVEQNTVAISHLRYVPSVSGAQNGRATRPLRK